MHRKLLIILAFSIIFAAAIQSFALKGSEPAADLVILNAVVKTLDDASPEAEAVVIQGERFIFVGSSQEAKKFIRPETRVIDAGGKLLLPGFNDAHVHLFSVGNIFSSLNLSSAKTQKEVYEKLEFYARFLPAGRWIIGSNLSSDISLSIETVDSLTPKNPVLLYRTSNDEAFVNSAALKVSRLDTANPELFNNSIERRSSDSKPTGTIRADALMVVKAAVPSNHTRNTLEVIETAVNYLVSFGITSVQDTHSDDLSEVLKSIEKDGRLKLRVYDCVSLLNWAKLAVAGIKPASGSSKIRQGCVKGFYEEDDAGFEELASNIKGADTAGLQVLIHAIGKKNVSSTLEIFEKAVADNPNRDRRFRIEHAHEISSSDIAKTARLNIVLSMQPALFSASNNPVDDFKKILDSKIHLAFGSDTAMIYPSPFEGIYRASSDKNKGLSLIDAVRAYTSGAAFAEFQENEKGTISPGKLADFILLDRNIFSVNDPAQVLQTQVVATFLGGKIVYENGIKKL
ncbi:MAG TPA: amidohydrolase [Pyrinomonadaceae bacterium]|nr:amidohydrolase [Pyrinomonadaceae bacterium]